MTTFSITNTTGKARDTEIVVNGERISGHLNGVMVHATVAPKHRVVVELAPAVIEPGPCEIGLGMAKGVRELLIRYGWSPPDVRQGDYVELA